MKTIPAPLAAQAASTDQAPVLAVAIAGWGGSTVRYNSTGASLTFGAAAYAARPGLQWQAVELSTSGKPVEATVSIPNEDLALSDLIDVATPIGATVTLYRVFLDDLTAIHTLATGLTVQSYRVLDQWAELRAVGLSKLLRRKVPARTLGKLCPYEFKGAECGYAGAAAYCSVTDPVAGPHEYTAEACQSLSNFSNFGGFLFALPRRP